MSFIEIKDGRIAGISTAVPARVVDNTKVSSTVGNDAESVQDFVKRVGIFERRESLQLTAADLSCEACERLIADLGWEKESIEAILAVTITPDYPLPVNACMIQDRLGLSKECYAQDISMGCSGWVYGLSAVASLLGSGNIKRAIMVTGESKMHWGKGVNDLTLGHAVSATAVEYMPGADSLKFHFGTDGSGADSMILPKSGVRNMHYSDEEIKLLENKELQRSMEVEMNSEEMAQFAINRVPQTIQALSDRYGIDYKGCDYLVLNQSNQQITDQLVKKLGVDPAKAISSLRKFGNTLSASIPVTITTQLKGMIENKKTQFVACGYGIGLSWGSVAFSTENIVISDLVEVPENRFEDLKWE